MRRPWALSDEASRRSHFGARVAAQGNVRKARGLLSSGPFFLDEHGVVELAVALIIAGAVLVSGLIVAYKPVVNCSVYRAEKPADKTIQVASCR